MAINEIGSWKPLFNEPLPLVVPVDAESVQNQLAVFSKKPAFSQPLHVGRPNLGNRARLLDRFEDILNRRWFTNNGSYVRQFEAAIAQLTGVEHCIAMCNATVALEILARAVGLSGEVIVPSFTFIATPHSLQWQQLTPVFCDIDPQRHTLDPSCVERHITPRTTGILATHVWGQPCDVEALTDIARRRGLKLIFDAAHALACTHRGQRIGGFGEAEVFSFHATKFANSFEGGAVVTNDADLAKRIRLMKNFGFVGEDNVGYIGTNGKMSEISAAMGLTSLEAIPDIIAANRRNYQRYRQGLDDLHGLRLFAFDENEQHNYQYVVVDVDEEAAGLTRDELVAVLRAENVLARRYFFPGCHRMEPYRSYFPHAGLLLPNTERVASGVLCLPTGTAVVRRKSPRSHGSFVWPLQTPPRSTAASRTSALCGPRGSIRSVRQPARLANGENRLLEEGFRMNTTARAEIDCSIIIPVYFNEGSLAPTLASIKSQVIARNPGRSFEVVFVDDGSGDRSLVEILRLREDNPELVRVVQFTRNFGQLAAVTAGFAIARGKCVLPISADGQDPVELMNQMLSAHFEEGYEIVACQRVGRDESFYRIATSRFFYTLMRKMCFRNMPVGGFDYVLLGRRAKEFILRNRETHAFFQGQVLWPGYRIKFLSCHRRERQHGRSRWTFGKKLTYLIDGVTAYSFLPIRLMSAAGMFLAICGLFYAALVFVGKLAWGNPITGWTPLMIVILVLGGFQMLMLGLMGEYVWRILAQVRAANRTSSKPSTISTRGRRARCRPWSSLAHRWRTPGRWDCKQP